MYAASVPFSAWLVDPVPKWLAAPGVLALLLTWGALTWWTHRRARSRGMTVASGLTLLGLCALVGSFALLLLFGTKVDATPVHEGDNSGTLIDVEATYETPSGETLQLRDATPHLLIWHPANSAEQFVTFMVFEPFPRVHQQGHRAMLANWRLVAALLLVAALAVLVRDRARTL